MSPLCKEKQGKTSFYVESIPSQTFPQAPAASSQATSLPTSQQEQQELGGDTREETVIHAQDVPGNIKALLLFFIAFFGGYVKL